MSNEPKVLDIEPTWETLCSLVEEGSLPAKELLPALRLADMIRKAQKDGAKAVVISFTPGSNSMNIETVEHPALAVLPDISEELNYSDEHPIGVSLAYDEALDGSMNTGVIEALFPTNTAREEFIEAVRNDD